jgi:electron transport complex protein RnfB
MDYYRKLQEKLDTHPAGAPATDNFDTILRLMFSPEEAEIASYLNFTLQPLRKLAQKTGVEAGKLRGVLDGLADRVTIFSRMDKNGEPRYSLVPTIPGLFEFPFMKKELTPNWEELADLWHRYHTEALGNAFAGTDSPLTRVVPVQRTIPMATEVMPYEQVSELVANSNYIALTDCACRVSVRGCDKPLDVCLVFGSVGQFLVEKGRARAIDKDEAIRVLNYAEDAGLVHCTGNTKDGASVICNCCGCCCTLLRGITVLDNPNGVAYSGYIVDYKVDECIGCWSCLEDRCPVKAVTEDGDVVAVDRSRCIGCGLCASVCPTEALSMIRRETVPPVPDTNQELMTTIMKKKGTLEAFIKVSQE